MDGLQALQALKDGKTVRDERFYYVFRPRYIYEKEDFLKYIWAREYSDWTWHRCTDPAEFWLKTDGEFEVVDDDKL